MKEMRKLFLFTALAVILFSCNEREKKVTRYTNDLEKVNEFSNAVGDAKLWGSPESVVKDVAHSGVYSSKLDSSNIFGFGFKSVFENILKSSPEKVNVKVWVYSLMPNPNATIVLDIISNGQSKYWKNAALNGVTKAMEWTECNASFELPSDLNLKDELKIYIWNPKMEKLYVDDYEISFE